MIIVKYNISGKCYIEKQDNLIMMQQIESESIDLIYCDILYNTGKKFKDYDDKLGTPQEAMEWYKPRLIEMKRLLKETGSIYLQCDYRLVHYLKVLMDEIFGISNFQNDIVWCYRSSGFSKTKWSQKHDDILFYSKSKKFTFNLEDVRENEISDSVQKRWGKEIKELGYIPTKKNGKLYKNSPYSCPRDWFIINALPQAHRERLNYDTQKPKELVERIIRASSNKNDIVADFFMGSGTTGEATLDLGRRFIGCDIGEKAFSITKERLKRFENKIKLD